ncbi:MAG: tetratricopeptide repeat protein [Acidimicrobiia bacterium]
MSTQQEKERELEFLVRSLQDLEAERTAGDIDPASYARLRREYVEREAEVRRALDGDGAAAEPERASEPASTPVEEQPRSRRKRLLLIGGIGAFAAVAAITLTLAVSDRLPGQTASGNSAAVTADDREARLEDAVDERSGDPLAHLALARFRLNTADFAGALEEYDAAAELDPTNPEPATYAGWVLYLASNSAADADQASELVDASVARLDAAVESDPDYPDARAFRGIVRFRGLGDPAGAIPDLQQFLAANPDHPFAPDVRDLLAEAVVQSE